MFMEESIRKILEIVTDLQEQMERMQKQMITLATKEDLEDVRKDHQAQIGENTRAIDDLTEQLRSVHGYAKEIDMLISQMSVLKNEVSALKK